MRKAIAPVLTLLALAAIAACGGNDATPTVGPEPTPTRSVSRPGPTPTPTTSTQEVEARRNTVVVGQFLLAHNAISTEWDAFREGYATWRAGLTGCEVADRQADLDGWVVQFQGVVQGVTGLETPAGASEVRDTLNSAVTTEEEGLRSLRDTWLPGDPAAFAAYEASRTEAAILRQQAQDLLVERLAAAEEEEATEEEEDPEEPAGPMATAEELQAYQEQIAAVVSLWNGFHILYNDWRESGGACDQPAVRSRLQGFVQEFQGLVNRVDAVERPSVVRPQAERLIEAAVLEQQALERLQAGWEPYDPAPWSALRSSQDRADLLRRQVRSGLDELVLEFGLGGGP